MLHAVCCVWSMIRGSQKSRKEKIIIPVVVISFIFILLPLIYNILINFFFLVKRAGRHFGFFKRVGLHEKGAGRRALQKKPRQNTAMLRWARGKIYENRFMIRSCEKCRHLERGTHVPDGGIPQRRKAERKKRLR